MTQHQCSEQGSIVLITHLTWWHGQRKDSLAPSMRETGGGPDTQIRRVGELPLTLQHSEECPLSSSGQHSRAGPDVGGGGETNLRVCEQKN